MPGDDTKRLILDVALRQFASLGYTAASIRSICREVGIKESSVYYHFNSKQEILDCLVGEFEAMAGGMNRMLGDGLANADLSKLEDSQFIGVGRMYYVDFLNNERIFLLIGMLMNEQLKNEALGSLYGRLMFDRPVETQTRFFELLTACGYFKELPAAELAVHYQSVFHFCFSRQLAMRVSVKQAAAEVETHLRFFLDRYKKERL